MKAHCNVPLFQAMTISFEIGKELEAIKEEAHRFAEKEIRPRLRDFERDGDVPEELREKFSELGLSLIDYPEEYGGSGVGLAGAAVIFEELAWGDVGGTLPYKWTRACGVCPARGWR